MVIPLIGKEQRVQDVVPALLIGLAHAMHHQKAYQQGLHNAVKQARERSKGICGNSHPAVEEVGSSKEAESVLEASLERVD